MITYTWTIPQLERRSIDGFVTTVHWDCTALADEDLSARSYGSVNWAEGSPTIPYNELTPEIVLTWVWEKVDKNDVEASLAQQIDQFKNPVTLSGLPW